MRERHGHRTGAVFSRAYNSWRAMKERCYNANFHQYADYGGRGITVCARWKDSFTSFLADMGEPTEGMTLDRKDNDKDYSPENCRWLSRAQQNKNRRARAAPLATAILPEAIRLRSEKLSYRAIAKNLDVSYSSVRNVLTAQGL